MINRSIGSPTRGDHTNGEKLKDDYFYSVEIQQSKNAIGMMLQWLKVVENRTNLFYNTLTHLNLQLDCFGSDGWVLVAPGRHA